MHSITMAVPQLFQADSSSAEKSAVREVLGACEKQLRSLDRRSRLRKGEKDQVEFQLPHVFHASSDLAENAAALEPLLECLCGIDLEYRKARPNLVLLYTSPVYYERTIVWDSIPALYRKGFGDCKSLACARIAEYRAAGQEARPVFRFLPPSANPLRQFQYHILVLGPYGWEDPSKIKGMELSENSYFASSPQS